MVAKMKLTKSKLKRIIKEEIENIQNEGVMDKLKSLNPFGKKEESREDLLLRITTEDFMGQLRMRGIQGAPARDAVKKAEKDIQRLVDRMLDVEPSEFNLCGSRPCNPRNEGPRDRKWEKEIRDLASKYSR